MTNYLKLGNLVSLIASAIILLALILLLYKGLSYVFSLTFQTLAFLIWILAIPSFILYHKASLDKGWILDTFAIPAIIITFVGLTLLIYGEFLGIEVILLGYTLEPIAGISIYLTTRRMNFFYSSLFFWGAVIFTVGLPLYLYNLGIISAIGDVIKTVGIIGLLSLSSKTLSR